MDPGLLTPLPGSLGCSTEQRQVGSRESSAGKSLGIRGRERPHAEGQLSGIRVPLASGSRERNLGFLQPVASFEPAQGVAAPDSTLRKGTADNRLGKLS